MPVKDCQNREAAMKARDLEKYFGALKDSDVLDEIRDLILRMREL